MNHPNQKPAKEIALRYTLKSSHILSLDIEKAASHKVFETTNKLVPEDLRSDGLAAHPHIQLLQQQWM